MKLSDTLSSLFKHSKDVTDAQGDDLPREDRDAPFSNESTEQEEPSNEQLVRETSGKYARPGDAETVDLAAAHPVDQPDMESSREPYSGMRSPEPATSAVFTQRAWTALMSEVLKKASTETGGILLGYRNGSKWIVVESLDPGPNSTFQVTYFEYDQPYVTHLANRVRNYYNPPLELLGLWHRHPGSLDQFSNTDDETNRSFLSTGQGGAISGLVNVDPSFRFTLYRVNSGAFGTMSYERIPYTTLDARESERVAPLRDANELAMAIERWRTDGHVGAIPQRAIDLSVAARAISEAIAAADGKRLHPVTSADMLMEWSDEMIELALEALSADIALFGKQGIELRVKLVDERHLELSASDGNQEERLCTLAFLAHPTVGKAYLCVLDDRQPPAALLFESKFFWQSTSSCQQ